MKDEIKTTDLLGGFPTDTLRQMAPCLNAVKVYEEWRSRLIRSFGDAERPGCMEEFEYLLVDALGELKDLRSRYDSAVLLETAVNEELGFRSRMGDTVANDCTDLHWVWVKDGAEHMDRCTGCAFECPDRCNNPDSQMPCKFELEGGTIWGIWTEENPVVW